MATCSQLDAYLDGELVDSAAFEVHILGCADCQAAIETSMQLVAAGAELSQHSRRPRPFLPSAPRLSRRRIALGITILVSVAAVAIVVMRPTRSSSIDDRVVAALAPRRPFEFRLPYRPLDHYRPYDVTRGQAVPESIPLGLTAEVEAKQPKAALAAVLIARADLAQADSVLASADLLDDEAELDRAALAILRDQPENALVHLDRILAHAPQNPVALWNRGLVLAKLQLPLTAAESFDEIAKLDEPGWNVEARTKASVLRDAETARSAHWTHGREACENIATLVPDRALVREHEVMCRPAFYEAVRIATSPEALHALRPVAEELDTVSHTSSATDLLTHVSSVDPATRRRSVDLYIHLTKTSNLSPATKLQLLEELRATKQADLVLGAIPRTQLPGLQKDYIARARDSKDAYFIELADERTADELLTEGDPLGAEALLRRAVGDCYSRDVELRCSYLQIALIAAYNSMHRPTDARTVALAALVRSRRLGLFWDERFFFNGLGQAARLEQSSGLMHAYVREATLRAGAECKQVEYAEEMLALASIDELRFDQARRDIVKAPLCDASLTFSRARVLSELSRFDGTAAEASELHVGLAESRKDESLTSGERASLDAIEGRLLANSDPDAAKRLLRSAIALADHSARDDADAAVARRDAYGELLTLAARTESPTEVLSLFAASIGTKIPDAGTCIVGVMTDSERLLVLVRDANGAFSKHLDEKGITSARLTATALIPAAMIASLAACPRVDVLALPPVFGLPNLLPPTIAWSYRSRSETRARDASSRPTILTVENAIPPADLHLPPLAVRRLQPIEGVLNVELTGTDATPERVVGALATADAIEIHAHGFVDLDVSDASMFALSSQQDGRFTLGAREISSLHLTRTPLVVLAACHAAYTAPYRHESWGLPRAFLMAGARAIFASPDTVSDLEAGDFFRAVEARTLKGEDPAAVLRDERVKRLATSPDSWVGSVLLFD